MCTTKTINAIFKGDIDFVQTVFNIYNGVFFCVECQFCRYLFSSCDPRNKTNTQSKIEPTDINAFHYRLLVFTRLSPGTFGFLALSMQVLGSLVCFISWLYFNVIIIRQLPIHWSTCFISLAILPLYYPYYPLFSDKEAKRYIKPTPVNVLAFIVTKGSTQNMSSKMPAVSLRKLLIPTDFQGSRRFK